MDELEVQPTDLPTAPTVGSPPARKVTQEVSTTPMAPGNLDGQPLTVEQVPSEKKSPGRKGGGDEGSVVTWEAVTKGVWSRPPVVDADVTFLDWPHAAGASCVSANFAPRLAVSRREQISFSSSRRRRHRNGTLAEFVPGKPSCDADAARKRLAGGAAGSPGARDGNVSFVQRNTKALLACVMRRAAPCEAEIGRDPAVLPRVVYACRPFGRVRLSLSGEDPALDNLQVELMDAQRAESNRVVFQCREPLELPMRDAGGKAEQSSALLAERQGGQATWPVKGNHPEEAAEVKAAGADDGFYGLLGAWAPGSLQKMRLALCLVLLWDSYEKWSLVPAFYENEASTYPSFALEEDAGVAMVALNPFAYGAGVVWPRVLLCITALTACGMMRWRWCSVVAYLLESFVVLRNVYVSFIFDRYLLMALLFSSCLPYAKSGGFSWAMVMFRMQLAWIYLDAGYGKVMGEWNWSTEVPALAVYLQGAPFGRDLIHLDRQICRGLAVRLLTVVAAWVEVFVGPALLAAALAPGSWVGFLPFTIVVLLHIGIATCMEGGFAICLVACGTWLATLPEARHPPARCMDRGATVQLKRFGLGDATVLCWCLGTMAFALSGYPSQPGPLPTVLLLNRWQVFSGAERHLHWEVAPARLADDAVVDLWSWHNVSFTTPGYGRRGRWMSFPSTRPATERALEARFRYLCTEWNTAHPDVPVLKYQLFELWAPLGPDLEVLGDSEEL
ncbi:unnamed protein product [Cladocopium goreaui]|uniref:HTTM domain-containing protein n=1 Tax=Cladocopium goreaui TaxID=2562237 RepID=A0A9P1DAD7_9DINO|nr:unnamed protein product [Cladocopium goreaui]